MGILSLLERRASPENPSTNLANPASWMVEWSGGGKTASGATVSEPGAMSMSAVFRAVSVLANTIAWVPLKVYERTGANGKTPAISHPLYPVLRRRPNPEMVSFTWRQTAMHHALIWGNAYAELQFDGAGRVVNIWPLLPDRTEATRLPDGTRAYRTRIDDTWHYLEADRVLHIPALGFDGRSGVGIVQRARESLGLGKATEEYGARYFGNGSRASGVLTHPGKLTPDAHKRLKESWAEMQSGLSNAHRAAILEEGMAWTQTSIPPEEAQFLETRKFQVVEVARWFGVPPHKLYDLERATFSNIEHQSIEFVNDSIMPWVELWQQTLDHVAFIESERDRFVARFVVDGLQRGDIQARFAAYAIARNWGWMSANDVRELENMNPVEDGDQYLVPLNMGPADAEPAPAPEPAPPVEKAPRALLPAPEERIRMGFERVIRSAAEHMVSREVKAARNALDRAATRGMQDFHAWLGEFYETQAGILERAYLPPLLGYAEAVGETPEPAVRAYVTALARTEAEASVGELRAILRDVPAEDQAYALRARLDEWERMRATAVAERESTQALRAFTTGRALDLAA